MFLRATRRSFLRLLAPPAAGISLAQAAPASVMAAQPRTARPGPVELLSCPVMGLDYYRYDAVSGALSPGTVLKLCREPRNRYDSRAIAVMTSAADKIGFVPRACNEAPANLMDAGLGVDVRLVRNVPLRKELWIAVIAQLNS